MTFSPVAAPPRPRLSDSIAEAIEQRIAAAELAPGTALPSERDLAQAMAVSRPSLREALQQLAARGLIAGKAGGGWQVRDLSGPLLAEPLRDLILRQPRAMGDVLELRFAIETVAATLAAERAGDEALARMEATLTALEAARAGAEPERAADLDVAFHLSVAAAAGNVALLHVMRGLYDLLRASVRPCQAEAGGTEIDRQHRAILDAIRQRDPATARQAAEAHLAHVRGLGGA